MKNRTSIKLAAIGAASIAGVASAALLGITFSDLPNVLFLTNGSTTYDAAQERFQVDTCPTVIAFDVNGSPTIAFVGGDEGMTLELRIRNDGTLLTGVPNAPDLELKGQVQVPGGGPLLDGVLLTGEILEYGSLDLSGELNDDGTDFFDFRFAVTGGLLANPYFVNADIGLELTSEGSTFVDDFTVDFGGGAKGTLGPIDRLLGESCCLNGTKPRAIELIYTGDDCEATTNDQDDKVECDDFSADPLPDCVYVVASKRKCNSTKSDDIYFQGEVCTGDLFVVDAVDLEKPEDHLKSNTYLCIYESDPDLDGNGDPDKNSPLLLQTIKFHTSCSQPLATGDQFASMLLVACTPEGTPAEGSCCNFGKPRVLTMEYTASDCSATMHGQDDGKVECEDRCGLGGNTSDCCVARITPGCSDDECEALVCGVDAFCCAVSWDQPCADAAASACTSCSAGGLPNPAYIIASKEGEDHLDHGHLKLFEGWVADGQLFDIDAANRGKDELDSETHIFILDAPLDEGGQICQVVKFHTSCSQPLFVGYQFGASLLIDCIGSDEPIPGDCCSAGKPAVLEMLYTGEDCEFTNHSQDPSKVSCDGDPADAATVYIIANNKENPNDGKIWFAGSVDIDTSYLISAPSAGENDLESETWIHIFDAEGGTEIQTARFHTSCSQPLTLGDQFGASKIIDCIDVDGTSAQ